MKLTKKIQTRLYGECHDIAAARTAENDATYPCDAEEIASDAYVKACKKARAITYNDDWETYIKVIADSAVKNELKRLDRANNKLNHRADRIDDPDFGDIRDPRQRVDIDPPPPDWLVMTRIQINKEHNMCRKVVTRLMNSTDTLIEAMRHVGVSACRYASLAKKLQDDFNQCLQAYHECLRRNCESTAEYCVVYTNGGMNDVGNGLGSYQDD